MEQRCYATRVRKIKDDVIQVSELELEPENHGRLVLVEELIQVELEPGKKHYWTGSWCNFHGQTHKLSFCNLDVFAWKDENMAGIGIEVVVHRLNINPNARPIK